MRKGKIVKLFTDIRGKTENEMCKRLKASLRLYVKGQLRPSFRDPPGPEVCHRGNLLWLIPSRSCPESTQKQRLVSEARLQDRAATEPLTTTWHPHLQVALHEGTTLFLQVYSSYVLKKSNGMVFFKQRRKCH